MKPGRRFGLSAEQKCDVWRRWKAGQTLHEIGRAFGKPHNSIRGVVSRHGGIAPPVRRRALLALTPREREEISRGLASGSSIREIAKCLKRAVSTVICRRHQVFGAQSSTHTQLSERYLLSRSSSRWS